MTPRQSDPSHETVTLKLTEEQRQLVINHTVAPSDLKAKLRLGILDGGMLTFRFTLDDLDELAGYVAAEANHTRSKKLERALTEVYDAIVTVEEGHMPPPDTPDQLELALPGLPADIREELLEVFEKRPPRDIDEANEMLNEVLQKHNSRPRPEFGGLSPEQLLTLVHGEWGGPESPVRLNEAIPFSRLQEAPFFLKARILLQAVADADGVKATAAGNLNRKFVLMMLDAMGPPHWSFEIARGSFKAAKEQDFSFLHITRVVLELARLIRRTKGVFRVTKKGRSLLSEAAAGKLYALLFKTHFRKLNLAYLDWLPETPSLQYTVAFSLLMVARHAATWQAPEALLGKLFLPVVAAEVVESGPPESLLGLAEERILRPLKEFGLLEFRPRKDQGDSFIQLIDARKTDLFDDFLTFDLG